MVSLAVGAAGWVVASQPKTTPPSDFHHFRDTTLVESLIESLLYWYRREFAEGMPIAQHLDFTWAFPSVFGMLDGGEFRLAHKAEKAWDRVVGMLHALGRFDADQIQVPEVQSARRKKICG